MNCCYLRCLLVSSSNFVLSVGKNEIHVFQSRDFRTGSSYEMRPLIYQNVPDSLFCFLHSVFVSLFILPSIIFSFLLSLFQFFHSLFYHPFSAFCILFFRFCLFYRLFFLFKKTLFSENIPVYCPFCPEHAPHMSSRPKLMRRCFTL